MRFSDLHDAYVRAWEGEGKLDSAQLGRCAYWLDQFGDTDHTAITGDAIDDCLMALAARGKLQPSRWGPAKPTGKPLSGASINRYKSALGSILKHAKAARLVKRSWHNPAHDVPAEPEGEGHLEFFTQDQVEAMLRASYLLTWKKMPVLVLLAFVTGLRRGNVMGLRWRWVDLEHGRVSIPNEEVKNGDPHVAHLNAPALAALRELAAEEDRKARSNDYGQGARTARDPDWLVFCRAKNPMLAHCIDYQWHKLLELAGVPYQKFHGLRHSTASHAAQAGASEIMLKNLLGHKSTRMVSRYAHLNLKPRAAFVDQHFTVALPAPEARPQRQGALAARQAAQRANPDAHVTAWAQAQAQGAHA